MNNLRSRDFYEGMRRADAGDLEAVAQLLAPLEAAGVLAPRSRAQLEADLPFFVVAEREAKVGATGVFARPITLCSIIEADPPFTQIC